ncbi:hypothetical protein [Marinimicrobium sp. ABcell2]|uniref:hypothetical protein n=1 Tax=Marinimicrobium sp. ABcell2 TaxID=3069751 RepID=UPI0027B41382|nr:hypothetical protein [Marinimicrobium sp. ABcell2]MDQ2078419.1 hypothetical protein [Marinimicrobium sp. ABcell2]
MDKAIRMAAIISVQTKILARTHKNLSGSASTECNELEPRELEHSEDEIAEGLPAEP